ncbi:hypothetical protein, unknown function [Leishmania mexicana MHOM/GT/2001/U1103]|uniref:Uncharacterized protein n=1 Tax=Leishmania mexicana (strain MHOM/GT/2001/U1103) TaxID=929439 RepID=E9AW44_LEIMU|nr:hypothetical protein, unknown function [Leishmania mexicana MHOM/GT/2001/U1103]CBZ27178.1 hypothetical protein, unknown function [Leishmania mexicana MHOM/GT/2001/U1103]
MPVSKRSSSLRHTIPCSVLFFAAHPMPVPSNACLGNRLATVGRQHRSRASRHTKQAPSVAIVGNGIPRPSPASVNAGVVEKANEPFAEYALPSISPASRAHAESFSSTSTSSSAFCPYFAVLSNGSTTMSKALHRPPTTVTALPGMAPPPPSISASVPRNGHDAARRTSAPLRVHPAHRSRSQPELTYSPTAYSSTVAASMPHEIPPTSALVLPYCTDAQLRHLFATLFVRAGDAMWSVHEHILPFLTAHQHCIMPAAPSQVAAFFGFTDHSDGDAHAKAGTGAASDPQGAQAFFGGAWTTKEISRFASQMGYWFMYVGILGCGEEMRWDTLLMPPGSIPGPSRRSSVRNACNAGSTSPPQALVTRSSSPSVHPATPEKQCLSPTPHRSPHNSSCVSSSAPGVVALTEGPKQHQPSCMVDDGGDGDDEGSPKSTVLYHTDQLERSTLDVVTTSTLTSVEFRAVVEAPPLVQEVAFVRGYKVLQTLLANREEQLAHVKNGPMAAALRALCTAAWIGNGANDNLGHSADCLAETLPPDIHAVHRRVCFYLRLHAFVRELCACLRADERRPWQRESYIVESIVSSRLRDTASFVSCDAPLARTAKMTAISETSISAGDRWRRLRDTLSQGVLYAALHAAPTPASVNSLTTLLLLRHAGATQVVMRATEGLPRSSDAVAASSFSSAISSGVSTWESSTSSRLPVPLLLLFPLPRWSSVTQPGIASRKDSTTFDLAASRALGFALALVVLSSCLFISGAQVVWTWCWTVFLEHSAGDDTAHHPHLVRRTWMHNLVEHCWTVLLLVCTARVAHHAGEVVASIEVTHTIVTAQSAALANESHGWLQKAWALQSGSAVAAQAVQRSIQRLRLVGNAVDGMETTPVGGRRALTRGVASRYWRGVFILALIMCTVKASLHPSRLVELAAVVMVACGANVVHVCETRQQRRRALAWWLHCQATIAESFADDLLRKAGNRCSEAVSNGADAEEQGGSVAQPLLPTNRAAVHTLCTIPLHMLEELANVACLVVWSEGLSLATHYGSDTTGPVNLSALPIQWFWEQLCGRAAPTYANGASSAAVVEATMRACRRSLEDKQRERGGAPLVIAEAVAHVLPWTLDYKAAPPPPTGALEGCHDYEVGEVLAPFAAAAAGNASGVVLATPHGDSSPVHPLDVELRRLPHLSPLQGRLVVCAAFVFASLRAAPRALGKTPRRCPAPFSACTGESTPALLTHLVHTQMCVEPSLWCRNDSEGTSTVQWRRAAKRTRAALQLLQQFTLSAQQCGVQDAPAGRAYTPVLPSLLHELFR